MFHPDFFPTPLHVIERMTEGINLKGKIILEPSAGKGNIVDYLQNAEAEVLACESSEELQKIIQTKCKLIAGDFLELTSDKISHIDFIIMNPPFSNADRHINHAFAIAPDGCKIVALCNAATLENTYTTERKQLKNNLDLYGSFENLGDCFSEAERKTGVHVAMITLNKPGEQKSNEFEGFFLDAEPEEEQANGLISYNVVRDIVNRYVSAVKLYDDVLKNGQQMNSILSGFYNQNLAFTCTQNNAPVLRAEFKKDLQKSGWHWVIDKMNLRKYSTKGLREEINKFVEQQTKIPFTMRNIYHMIDMVIQTAEQRMDKAIIEAFDNITQHHADNRHHVKGWKTNSHFLVGKKFILPNCVSPAKEYGYTSTQYSYLQSYKQDTIEDLEKALCFTNGIQYDNILTLRQSINRNTYGEYYNSEFFKYKAFKNGNMHFEFLSEDVWAKFNQRVSKIKGYPIFEGKEQTAYQKRQTGRKAEPKTTGKEKVLFEFSI